MCNTPLLKLRTNAINQETGNYIYKWLSIQTLCKSLDEIKKIYGNDLIEIPCGKCEACKAAQKQQLAVRTAYAFKDNNNIYFLTLTFEKENYIKKAEENAKEFLIKNFKAIKKNYLASYEHGKTTGRGHFHIITELTELEAKEIANEKTYKKYWHYGFIKILAASIETIFYTANYTTKKTNNKDIVFFSKGLGKEQCLRNADHLKKTENIIINGKIYPLPRYFKKLLYKNLTAKERFQKTLEKANINKGINNLERSKNELKKPDEIALKNFDEKLRKERTDKKNRNIYL